jgi:hypothetical protein
MKRIQITITAETSIVTYSTQRTLKGAISAAHKIAMEMFQGQKYEITTHEI